MEKYIKKIIGLVIILLAGGFILSSLYIYAQDTNEPIDYTASDTRDPFSCCLPEKPKETPVEQVTQPQVEIKLPEMNIQGIVWQTDNPQAIIDGKVLKIGDSINDAKIIKIKKEGVGFFYQEKLFTVNSPNVEILNSTKAKEIVGGAK